jgi:hypothetical protein
MVYPLESSDPGGYWEKKNNDNNNYVINPKKEAGLPSYR